MSAYLSVISSALALSAAWSPQWYARQRWTNIPTDSSICSQTTSRLVLFDSGLGALKLPILRSLSFDGVDNAEARRRDTLSVLLERYFEWQAEFPEGNNVGRLDMRLLQESLLSVLPVQEQTVVRMMACE